MTAHIIPIGAARVRAPAPAEPMRDQRTAAVRNPVRNYAINIGLNADDARQCVAQAISQLTNGRSAFYAIQAGEQRADHLRAVSPKNDCA